MDRYQALGLSPGSIVAAVGGGGKTSLVYGLANDAVARGLSAIVGTTTKFTRPRGLAMPQLVETTDARAVDDLGAAIAHGQAVAAVGGYGDRGRMLGLLPGTFDRLAALGAGLIAVEADGAAQRPFKAPAEHEPVIPGAATDVAVCVGLDVLGKPLDDRYVHRSALVARLAGAAPGDEVTPAMIIEVLIAPEGGRKNVPAGARLHLLLAGEPDTERDRLATYIARRAVFAGYCRGVIASARAGEDVRAVVQ